MIKQVILATTLTAVAMTASTGFAAQVSRPGLSPGGIVGHIISGGHNYKHTNEAGAAILKAGTSLIPKGLQVPNLGILPL